jgi:hypothetical protein
MKAAVTYKKRPPAQARVFRQVDIYTALLANGSIKTTQIEKVFKQADFFMASVECRMPNAGIGVWKSIGRRPGEPGAGAAPCTILIWS